MKLTAQVFKDEGGGFYAEVPEVPGTVAHGDTLDELAVTLQEVFEIQLRGLLEDYRERAAVEPSEETPVDFWSLDLSVGVLTIAQVKTTTKRADL